MPTERVEKPDFGVITELFDLENELQRKWQQQQRTGARPVPRGSENGANQLPQTQRVPSGAKFVGRQVLSRALPYAERQLGVRAGEAGLDYHPVRQPMGLRYLGHNALAALKEYSLAVRSGEVAVDEDSDLRVIERFGDILDVAREDEGFNSGYAATKARLFTDSVHTIQYDNDEAPTLVVIGVKLAAGLNPWEPATDIKAEREYLLQHYLTDFEPGRAPSKPFVPLGWVGGVEKQDKLLASVLSESEVRLIGAAVVLGPVDVINESEWDES